MRIVMKKKINENINGEKKLQKINTNRISGTKGRRKQKW